MATYTKNKGRLPAAERRAIILARAQELFAERGYHGVSVEEVANAAGVTKPVLYDHFRSKEALFVAVTVQIRDHLLQLSEQSLPSSGTKSEAISSVVAAFFVFAEKQPSAIEVLVGAPRAERKLYRQVQAIQDGATDSLVEMISAIGMLDANEVVEPERARIQVEFIKLGLHALALWRLSRPSLSRAKIVEAVAALVDAGLR